MMALSLKELNSFSLSHSISLAHFSFQSANFPLFIFFINSDFHRESVTYLYGPSCPHLFSWFVGRSVIIIQKDEKLHFHAPIIALVL